MTAPKLAADPAAARRRCHFRLPAWTVFGVSGSDAADLLSRLSTNDLAPLARGQSVTTLFLTPTGRVLHRVLLAPGAAGLLAIGEEGSAGNWPAWVDRYTFAEDARIEPRPQLAVLRVVLEDEAARPELESLAASFPQLRVAWRAFGSRPSALLAGSPADLDAMAAAGTIGEELTGRQAEQLRVECGEPASGSELSEERFPLEAGLERDISFTKGCYTGQEVVARQDSRGKVARRLARVLFAARPAAGDPVVSGGREAGAVTSVAPDPVATEEGPRYVTLAYIASRDAEPGARVELASGLEGVVLP